MTEKVLNAASRGSDNKILWLSVIQGWAILLVVIGHVNAFTYQAPGEFYPLAGWIHRFCYAFHMPLFMFVSGGLLYFTRIRREWKTLDLYKDKLKRLLIPYLAFTLIGFLVKVPLSSITKSGVDASWSGLVDALINPGNGPLKELWFLGTLMWLMFMYPVYRVMLRSVWGDAILLAVSLVPFVFGVHFNFSGWVNLASVSRYAFFFVGGMLFFKYDALRLFSRHNWLVVVVTMCFVECLARPTVPEVITASFGILTSFAWGGGVGRRFPRLFSSFRDHSFQIFLVGIFPQMFVELIVWQRVHSAWMVLPFYLVSCGLALGAGVLVSRAGMRLPRVIRWCLGLK